MSSATSLRIVDFNKTHTSSAVAGLLKVRETDPTYPPPHDADATTEDFTSWLFNDAPVFRFVAVDGDVVAGHISVVPAHDYLLNYCAKQNYVSDKPNGLAEISKFFVNPYYQKHGVGDLLFTHAFNVLREHHYQPALAVISTSTKAIRFYRKHGMQELGSFEGIHGKNFVFVDQHPASIV